MIYLLFDSPSSDKGNDSFISRRTSLDIKEVYSPRANSKFVGWLKGVVALLRQSQRNDVLVCWFDFQAVMCFWLCKVLLLKRRIVCINLMLKDKDTLKNKVVAWLYQGALRSKHFVASVTSLEYGRHLKQRLGLECSFSLVHDVYHATYQYYNPLGGGKRNTVFCGGKNGRDWQLMIDVAKALPSIPFTLVMPSDIYEGVKVSLPQNVNALHNVPLKVFMTEMCSASLVALPLDTEAPAGLIVLFQAAANGKYILTTDTMTTREYLANGRGSLLPNDVSVWKEEIQRRIQSEKENELAIAKMREFLETQCSEEMFVKGVEEMIKRVQ